MMPETEKQINYNVSVRIKKNRALQHHTELSEARVAVTHQPGDLLRAGNKVDPGGNRDNKVKVNYNVSVLIKRHM